MEPLDKQETGNPFSTWSNSCAGLIEIWEDRKSYYLFMELCSGGELFHTISKRCASITLIRNPGCCTSSSLGGGEDLFCCLWPLRCNSNKIYRELKPAFKVTCFAGGPCQRERLHLC